MLFTIFLKNGLAIQLHYLFSSRLLIDHLHELGYCSSYNEVTTYERSAATISSCEQKLEENSVVQHVADNADHNLCTLDGKGTFHGMKQLFELYIFR